MWPLFRGDNLLMFYYFSASEIFPDKRPKVALGDRGFL
jgi:hypothetical protein